MFGSSHESLLIEFRLIKIDFRKRCHVALITKNKTSKTKTFSKKFSDSDVTWPSRKLKTNNQNSIVL